jgi:hypothetical protein
MDDVDLKRYARIAALDAQGAILGSTPAIDTHNCNKVDLDYNVTEVFGVDATVITGVPSSAGIIMPLGTGATRWGYFNSTEDEDEADGEEDQVMGLSMSTILGAGAVAGAVIVITGAIV